MRDKIAVIILTYNRYHEFWRAFKSALTQKGIDFEILVFDNCSDISLKKEIDKYTNVTYIRHKKNIGFGNNLKFALNFSKKKKFNYSFLLSDDDLLSYDRALYDLKELFKKEKEIHVIRGGFAIFENDINNITQIFTYNKKRFDAFVGTEIEKALHFNITFYSGIMFKNKYISPNLCKVDDLVSPLILPLLSILKTKKYNVLPEKIIILSSFGKDQLATRIYNESISNTEAIQNTLRSLNVKVECHPSIFELINYKIYSSGQIQTLKYYEYSIRNVNSRQKILYFLVMNIPKSILIFLKKTVKQLYSLKYSGIIKKYHPYLSIYK